jgi:hypothetical protein
MSGNKKLTYELLMKLVDPAKNHHLEIVPTAITRLDGDGRDIELGETVAFVANFSVRMTSEFYELVGRAISLDEKIVELFKIDKNGEVVTELEGFEFDKDGVAKWLGEHFDFSFRVSGVETRPVRWRREQPVDADLYGTVYPWLQEINVVSAAGDVVDIDFEVKPRRSKRRQPEVPLIAHSDIGFDQAEVRLQIVVEGNHDALENLRNRDYWIDLHSTKHPDLKLRLKVEKVGPREVRSPKESAKKNESAQPAGK